VQEIVARFRRANITGQRIRLIFPNKFRAQLDVRVGEFARQEWRSRGRVPAPAPALSRP
jgi:hypothetical protein